MYDPEMVGRSGQGSLGYGCIHYIPQLNGPTGEADAMRFVCHVIDAEMCIAKLDW